MAEHRRQTDFRATRALSSIRIVAWPSLFGRATLLTANQRLQRVVAALLAVGTPEPGGRAKRREEARALLTPELCISLAAHFAAEESESYYGVIARDAPWLTRELDEMKDEHRKLLVGLSRLVFSDSREPVNRLASEAERLSLLIATHERKEGRLLRKFLLSSEVES